MAGPSRWTSRRQTRSRRSSSGCRTESASRPTSSACFGQASSWLTTARWPTTTFRARARSLWRCVCAAEEDRGSAAHAQQLRRHRSRCQLRGLSLPRLLHPGAKQRRPLPLLPRPLPRPPPPVSPPLPPPATQDKESQLPPPRHTRRPATQPPGCGPAGPCAAPCRARRCSCRRKMRRPWMPHSLHHHDRRRAPC